MYIIYLAVNIIYLILNILLMVLVFINEYQFTFVQMFGIPFTTMHPIANKHDVVHTPEKILCNSQTLTHSITHTLTALRLLHKCAR